MRSVFLDRAFRHCRENGSKSKSLRPARPSRAPHQLPIVICVSRSYKRRAVLFKIIARRLSVVGLKTSSFRGPQYQRGGKLLPNFFPVGARFKDLTQGGCRREGFPFAL